MSDGGLGDERYSYGGENRREDHPVFSCQASPVLPWEATPVESQPQFIVRVTPEYYRLAMGAIRPPKAHVRTPGVQQRAIWERDLEHWKISRHRYHHWHAPAVSTPWKSSTMRNSSDRISGFTHKARDRYPISAKINKILVRFSSFDISP